ncbi:MULTISPECIES: translocation/assembly module TamB domain-containing protein [Psychrobacter]|uniref:translocation/assembly module TamB domain-containing protein n=1 Tax=Psychrobacter TaxID=497 RepID=UPI00086C327A|nr:MULTISPECIES: translocation/assembly module TamB domain-containing protein [Psychrobacter]MBA6243873.1 translocation/assembly module TamB domain-containing protein [Psychrobacter sp. Urea-trap-18]MBA6285456.1 translocation/assembly module TamB domain-containing protein [Psychrobacter sp. Urea-trap-16]MBA6319024.1 translocation/assembly module TamB domain-containing protein [Psychrobacter sp. Urea-trap-20]MBA6335043.1 translocation/assembly module TamB domain-containing protein [Psychrobacter
MLTENTPPNNAPDEDPAQRDARAVRRWYPLSFLLKLLVLMLIVLAIMFAIFFYAAGTDAGTKFILEKISVETGIDFKYGRGNLRDGIWVTDIDIEATEDLEILVDKAYVKIGWRAVFAKEVHLSDADIQTIEIINKKPPTGEPFDYKTLKLPVNLRFDQAKIKKITYKQVTKDPIIIQDITARDLTWVGSTVTVGRGDLQYADIVKVSALQGEIDLQGDYPLDLSAIAEVSALEKAYIDPLNISATGTLKRTVGKVRSRYNDSDVKGDFVVQGLDAGAPFDAKLQWDDILIPYADSQNIRLQSGTATASGVISEIRLRINTELTAKDIPSGHYQGRAVIANSQLRIDRLDADVPAGRLALQGILDWKDSFEATVRATGSNFNIRQAIPAEYADFKAYAPQTLNGRLSLRYQQQNPTGNTQIDADLRQRDGEHINANMIRGKTSAKSKQVAPWYIDANWKNLTRRNVPNIGNIDSPSGQADVIVRGSTLSVDANAVINELNAAPKGNYDLRIRKAGDVIDINRLNYNGIVGDLSGTGQIQLASKQRPLTWQIDASTKGLLPKKYRSDLPLERLTGSISARGRLLNITKNGVSGQRHVITLNNTDMQAQLDATQADRAIGITGAGDASVDIVGGELSVFDARFDGRIDTADVPQGRLSIDAAGTPKLISIRKLNYKGEAGAVDAKGVIDLRKNIGWNIDGRFDQFNLGYFLPNNPAIITGDLKTSGEWQNAPKNSKNTAGTLQRFAVNFNGILDAEQLPAGKLNIEASGDSQLIRINRFRHVGAAGSIDASGTVDVRQGVAWDINAVMDRFNIGYFLKDTPSLITGTIDTDGRWSDTQQIVNIKQVNLNGMLKGQQLSAKGSLSAKMRLPKDLASYFKQLQTQDAQAQYKQVNALIDSLNANNLVLRWGDNYVTANGNAKQLQTKINITSLDQLSSQLAGKVTGGATLSQPAGQALPTIYIDLVGERLALPGFILRQGRVRGKLVNLANSPSQLIVTAEGLDAAGQSFDSVKASFNGTEKSHVVDLNVANKQLDVGARLKGGFDRDRLSWSGVIGKGRIKSKYATLNQLQPAQLIVNLPYNQGGENRDLKVQLAAHCWQATDQTGKLCLREKLVASPDQGEVNVALQNLDTSLFSVFLPEDIDWNGKINGKAIVGWQRGRPPTINTTLYSDNGKIGLVQDGESTSMTLPYKRVSLIALSVPEGIKLRTDINTGRGARGYAEVIVDPYKDPKPISGALVLNELDLAIFKPFFPGMRVLRGNVTMAGGLGGTLTKPQFYGDVKLSDGRIAMLDLPVNLSKVNVAAKIRGTQATIDGTFNSGTGEGELSGTVNWQQKLQAKLSIVGEGLVITQPPLLVAEIDPDIDIIVRPGDRYVDIKGAISVPSATIRPPEASEDIITQTEDAVVLDRRLIGNIDEVLAISKPWSINADIGVDLGDDINFRGFGAVIPLAGAINVTQNGTGIMRARGVVQVSRRTNINAFGQSLELNYGQVRFNGDVMKPSLSIEAAKTINGKTVGLRVKGTTESPNIIVFNNAGLTQQQAMNALVTGRIDNKSATQISEQGFKSQVTNNLAAAGLSFGLSGTRSLTNQIGQAFGLQSLTVDASGSSEDTNVNVTGYVTPDLYIRYGVGVFNAQNSLSVRYQLTRRIYVEASSAAENAVDVVYSWQF